MAGQNEQKQVLLFGLRSGGQYGDDTKPTAAMLVSNISHTPLAGNTVNRDNYRGMMGASGKMRATNYQEVSFDLELTASGTKGKAPAYSELLRACGLAEEVTADTSVIYTPVDENFEDGTVYYYCENHLHKLTGARGSVEFDLSLGVINKAKIKMIGLYSDPSKKSAGNLDFSAFKTPIVANSQTVKTFQFFGKSNLQMNTLTVNPGINIAHTDLTNQESVDYIDRAGTVSAKFREPDLADKDFFTAAKTGEQGDLVWQLGDEVKDAGQVVKVEVPNIQVDNTARSFEQGRSMLTVSGDIVPTARNTDFTLTFL